MGDRTGKYSGRSGGSSPGPAAYYPKNLDAYKRSQPKYTIAGRLDGKRKHHSIGPGPANYGPNLYMPGRNPEKYSFGVRHNVWPYFTDLDKFQCEE